MLTRPRPYGVKIIAGWGGFALPSAPVAALTAVLIGIVYSLVVPGRPRWFAKLAIARPHRPLRGLRGCIWRWTDLRRAVRADPGRGVPADGVPLVHAERGVSRRLSERQHGAPRRDRATRRSDPRGGAGAARTHGARDQAGRAGGIGRFHPASPQGRGRTRHLSVREAVREESRARGPLVQAVADRPVRLARGRGLVPVRPAVRRVRGLHVAADDGRRHPRADTAGDRRDLARARVHDRHGVLRGRRGDRGCRRRRGSRGRGTLAGPQAVGRGSGASRHQTREPHGQGRARAPDRCLLRSGETVTVAAGGGPRQHDARPRGPLGRRPRVPARTSRSSPPTRSPKRSPPPVGSRVPHSSEPS